MLQAHCSAHFERRRRKITKAEPKSEFSNEAAKPPVRESTGGSQGAGSKEKMRTEAVGGVLGGVSGHSPVTSSPLARPGVGPQERQHSPALCRRV